MSDELSTEQGPTDPPFEQLIRRLPDAVIYVDRRGVIRLWNDAATELFGFDASEAVGASLDLIISNRFRAAHWAGFNRAMSTGVLRLSGRPTLTRGVQRHRDRLYVEMSFGLVFDRSTGQPCGAVAVARDATDRVGREPVATTPPPDSDHGHTRSDRPGRHSA